MENDQEQSGGESTKQSERRYPALSPEEKRAFLLSFREDLLAGAAQMAEGNEVLDLVTGKPIPLPYQLPKHRRKRDSDEPENETPNA